MVGYIDNTISVQISTQSGLGDDCCLPQLLRRVKFFAATIDHVIQRRVAVITRCNVGFAVFCLCCHQFEKYIFI